MKKNNQGFTFIEMLVVTTIIVVLTLVGVANFRVANQKTRDGRRKSDLQQIRAALELYRADENDYPTDDIIDLGTIESTEGTIYMGEVPVDPKSDYNYDYNSDGATYILCASLELGDEAGTCGIGSSSCGIEACNYQVVSPL